MGDALAGSRTSPRRGRPRFFPDPAAGAGGGVTASSSAAIRGAWLVGVGAATFVALRAGRSRASIAVPSRLRWPISCSPRCSLISASCTRSASRVLANSANAREKVASEGRGLNKENPQMRRSARSICRRSINPAVVVIPNTALATNAFASQARSCAGRPTPHHEDAVSSSMRTHSRM